jgi:hypothetical protein
LLATGHRPAGDGEAELVLRYGPVPTATHAVDLAVLLRQAQANGYARTVLEDGLVAEAMAIRRLPDGFSAVEANGKALVAAGISQDDALVRATTHRRLQDRRQTFSAQLPLPLLPFPVDAVADLLLGDLDLVISCDASVLESRLATVGVKGTVYRGAESGDRFLSAEHGDHLRVVPAPTCDQILVEGLTLDCMAQRVAWMFEDMPPPGQNRDSAVAFRDEASAFIPIDSPTL